MTTGVAEKMQNPLKVVICRMYFDCTRAAVRIEGCLNPGTGFPANIMTIAESCILLTVVTLSLYGMSRCTGHGLPSTLYTITSHHLDREGMSYLPGPGHRSRHQQIA